jgi:lysine 6-dehydrogenase
MSWTAAVLGAGRQGVAAAYDLVLHGGARRVLLFDQDEGRAVTAAARVDALIGRPVAAGQGLDAREGPALARALAGVHGVLSALPYPLNPLAAAAAIQAGAHFADLGGNTAIVRRTLELDSVARARGVSVLPDCGLAPGLGNVLATCALERLADPRGARILCGGLPEDRTLPLGYKLVFHVGGLLNEYSGEAEVLRGGRLVRIPALGEVEPVDFPPPLGVLEAFATSGGTSTACETWKDRLESYEYKTLRYPGHAAVMRGLRDLGLFDTRPVVVGGHSIVPRDVLHVLCASAFDHPETRDLVVMRVEAWGRCGERVRFDLLDRHDPVTGFTAMERTTAFPAAATLALQVAGEVRPGASTPERVVPAERLVQESRTRGIALQESRVR